jgi:ubiquitin carboxyl-terminal hydrolase L3
MAELSANQPKQWFPLESNPVVMNRYMGRLGLNLHAYSFHDVFSTEDWALEMVPKPVLAVLLLFPITERSEAYAAEEETRIEAEQAATPSETNESDNKVRFIKQTIGNACGTIGLLHAVTNAHAYESERLFENNECYIANFINNISNLAPEDIAAYLEEDEELEETHVEAAEEGDTEAVMDVDAHFICFR